MFDLLRQGDLRPQPDRISGSAAAAARYLDRDAANSFIARGVTSFRMPDVHSHAEIEQPPTRAFAKFRLSNQR